MRFLVDAQLPPALALWLREAGHDAHAVREVDLRGAADREIWDHAIKNDAVLLTKDEDFPNRAQRTHSGPTIVWLRLGNATNAELRRWFLPRTTAGDSDGGGRGTHHRNALIRLLVLN